jgi:predicted amidohydrolase YtcJ
MGQSYWRLVAYQFEENRFPTLEELREAVSDQSMIVQYAYNRAFLNARAMEALGVGTDRFPQYRIPNSKRIGGAIRPA